MKKINCVLLVDDSASTNVYHKKIIEKTGAVDTIDKVSNGLEALDYLSNSGKYKDVKRPNIIFLDINMPKMDGFEFLKNYIKLPQSRRADIVVVFLTTSNWEKDKMRAIENDVVFDFLEKPLNQKDLERVCDFYFKNVIIT